MPDGFRQQLKASTSENQAGAHGGVKKSAGAICRGHDFVKKKRVHIKSSSTDVRARRFTYTCPFSVPQTIPKLSLPT